MRKTLNKPAVTLLLLLVLICLIACRSIISLDDSTSPEQFPDGITFNSPEEPSPLPINTPTTEPEVPSASTYPLDFSTKEEFHQAVINARKEFEQNGIEALESLETIADYLDFTHLPKDLFLKGIFVKSGYIALYYIDNYENRGIPLMVVFTRDEYGCKTYDDLLKEIQRISFPDTYIETSINGHSAIKQPVYWDGKFVCNQYFWIENGYEVQVTIPEWLLEQYPEDIFFEIKIVSIEDEQAIQTTAEIATQTPSSSKQAWQNAYAEFLKEHTPTFEVYYDATALSEGDDKQLLFGAFSAAGYPLTPFFYLYDIDNDGEPELILTDAANKPICCLYTYKNNSV